MRVSNSAADRALAGRAYVGLVVAVGTLVYAFLVVLAEQAGVPRAYTLYLTGILLVLGVAVTGFQTRTMSASDWLVAGRSAGALTSAMALAASLIAGWTMVVLGGQFFIGSYLAPVWIVSPLLALAAISFLIAPYLRTSGALTPAEFVSLRFESRWPGIAFALAGIVAGVLLLWGAMVLAGALGRLLWGIDRQWGIAAAAALCALVVIPGGVRGMIRVNAAIFAFLATAYLAPLVWPSLTLSGFPVPQLSFGYAALESVRTIEEQLRSLGVPLFEQHVNGAMPVIDSTGQAVAFGLFLAAGLCAMPFVLGHFPATRGTDQTRHTAGWAMAMTALVLTAAPALAAFVKLGLYNSLLGLTVGGIGDGAGWLLEWSTRTDLAGAAPMVTLCGKVVSDTAAAVAACGGNPDYVIAPADVDIASEMVTLALSEIVGLPTVLGAMVGVAALAASLATANAVAAALGVTVSRDLLAQNEDRPRPSSRVLFVVRLSVALALAGAAWLAIRFETDAITPALWAVAIAGAIFAPVIIAAIWWNAMNRHGALAGIVGGAIVLGALAAMSLLGPDFRVATGDEHLAIVPELASLPESIQAGLLALPVVAAMIVAGSYTRRAAASAGLLDAIRRPGGRPLVRGPEV